ncbi:MAG: NADH:flavin oxidoreductase / NADH oxidase [Dehalococcoidales bacterium]|nr:NADH:flavin oxidoreductase / NADH oxidase [Dehalococcoidales bacterium]
MPNRKSLLFSPYELRSVTFRNRIVLSPMQMYLAGGDGIATDWHFQHLAKYAVAGAGCVFTEVLPPEPRGRNTHWDLGIWDDSQVPALTRIAQFIEETGAVPAAQTGHAGTKAARQRPFDGLQPLGESDTARGEPPWQPVGPMDKANVEGYHPPHALSPSEIHQLVDDFGKGVARLAASGFRFLEVHAAHGYLIHSFYSPISNQRTDAYGGDRAGRMRFALEVAESVRVNWPEEFPLSFRISSVDAVDGGWDLQDSVALVQELKSRGVDIIDCSSRGVGAANSLARLEKEGKALEEGYQVPYSAHVRKTVPIPTMAVGLITRPEFAEKVLKEESADLIALGRELLYNPHWVLHAAHTLECESKWEDWPPSWNWWLEKREKLGIKRVD